MLENFKNAIIGIYHAIRGQHTLRYLTECWYRLNRQYDLVAVMLGLLVAALKAFAMPYSLKAEG
ncbi:MAG: transposase [Sodalis sp. (in: enterobacteria)]